MHQKGEEKSELSCTRYLATGISNAIAALNIIALYQSPSRKRNNGSGIYSQCLRKFTLALGGEDFERAHLESV
jgi:hypothetical protein